MSGYTVRLPVDDADDVNGGQPDRTVVHGLDCACCRHDELTMRELAEQTARAANGALEAARSATEAAQATLALMAELRGEIAARAGRLQHSVV
jgi:capsule polysaccharide export protein KpsE/RkpR